MTTEIRMNGAVRLRRGECALTGPSVTSFRHAAQHCKPSPSPTFPRLFMVPQTSRPATETGYFVPLLLCLGALLALRIAAIHFAKIDLVPDEAQYWTWSRELAFGYFSKPPMIAWVIRFSTTIYGDGEACIRSASPVLHTLSSFVLFLIGRQLFVARVGFWSAIVFDTLPGLSYSSLLITTDVPLVLIWTVALLVWVLLVKRPSMWLAVFFGAVVGLGLL